LFHELIERNELDAIARHDRRRRRACHAGIGIGVTKCRLPVGVHVTVQGCLEAMNAVSPRQDEKSRIVRVRQRNIVSFEVIHRRRVKQARIDVPFDENTERRRESRSRKNLARIHAANHELIAIAFTLVHATPGTYRVTSVRFWNP
jgi:hypothetical protein